MPAGVDCCCCWPLLLQLLLLLPVVPLPAAAAFLSLSFLLSLLIVACGTPLQDLLVVRLPDGRRRDASAALPRITASLGVLRDKRKQFQNMKNFLFSLLFLSQLKRLAGRAIHP